MHVYLHLGLSTRCLRHRKFLQSLGFSSRGLEYLVGPKIKSQWFESVCFVLTLLNRVLIQANCWRILGYGCARSVLAAD